MRTSTRHRDHPGRRDRRPFDYGALRLILLGMIAARPSHGYELMRAIEERSGGGYKPSPGVIYPTLAWLEDMGFATVSATGSRKSYRVTKEGEAFLAANRAAVEALDARMGPPCGGRRRAPEPVLRGMEALKRALRARFLEGEAADATVARIAAVLEQAAKDVENCE